MVSTLTPRSSATCRVRYSAIRRRYTGPANAALFRQVDGIYRVLGPSAPQTRFLRVPAGAPAGGWSGIALAHQQLLLLDELGRQRPVPVGVEQHDRQVSVGPQHLTGAEDRV